MEKLKQAYNPATFKKQAYALVDILTEHLEASYSASKPANQHLSPEKSLAYWQKNWDEPYEGSDKLFKDIISKSVNVHNSKYIGHQVTPTVPIAALASLLSSVLNNGMANYEMGNVSSTLEKLLVDFMLNKFTWKQSGSGFLTSGGTLANLTALLAARRAKAPENSWFNGHNSKLVVFITEEAHYCVDRALRVMGFGDNGIIKVPVDSNFKMDLNALSQLHKKCIADGYLPIAVVASGCSTSTGVYDDIDAMADFCESNNLWLHIDGAHGGSAIFSEQYKYLLKGADRADSIIIDAHKMMMAPALCTFALFKDQKYCNSNFAQKAQYLWEKADDEDWYNYGRKTFECTKLMMSIKVYAIIKEHGEGIFTEFVDTLYNAARDFASVVNKHPDFELLMPPESNIMCFRYTKAANLNKINKALREYLLNDGEFYIVQTELNGEIWLRLSIMNPFTTVEIFEQLIQKICYNVQSLAN